MKKLSFFVALVLFATHTVAASDQPEDCWIEGGASPSVDGEFMLGFTADSAPINYKEALADVEKILDIYHSNPREFGLVGHPTDVSLYNFDDGRVDFWIFGKASSLPSVGDPRRQIVKDSINSRIKAIVSSTFHQTNLWCNGTISLPDLKQKK